MNYPKMKQAGVCAGGGVTTKAQQLIKEPKTDAEKVINLFLKGEVGKRGKYFAVANALVYRTLIQSNRTDPVMAQNVIALRLDSGQILGNSSVLPLIGRTVSFGNESTNRGVTDVQLALSSLITMIPFNVFLEASLDLNQFKILERGPEEKVTRLVLNPKDKNWDVEAMEKKSIPEFIEETVHFTGASLFNVQDKTFLFDIDREEIKHKIFNAFLVSIPTPETSIVSAYAALKPEAVKLAEADGVEVIRQGEWFLIDTGETDETVLIGEADVKVFGGNLNRGSVDRMRQTSFTLKAGPNRPNYAQYGFNLDGKAFVKGRVEHSGREHRPLSLKRWYIAIPNTAIESFTIEGDVD